MVGSAHVQASREARAEDALGGASRTGAALGAIAFALAYYFGSRLGFTLRFPPTTTSILWPPNAILTAVLLLAPPRRWWIFLLAALPAHVAVQVGAGLPLPLILAFYGSNCFEAIIAASLAHRFSDAPARFDTFRRAALFLLAAVLVAPVVSGFADAAAVSALRGEPYWGVWRARLFSNSVSALALVPLLVWLVRSPAALRAPRLRWLEGTVLILLLIAAGSFIFIFAHPVTSWERLHPWWERSEFVILLAPLLWAAASFGAAGSSFAVLTTSLIAFLAATTGNDAGQTAHMVRGLQVFLLLTGIPLFAFGALMDERRAREQALQGRLRFEELLSRISAAFIHLPSNAMEAVFADQLRQVGECSGLSAVLLFRRGAGEDPLVLASSWSAPGHEQSWPPRGWSQSALLAHAAPDEDILLDHGDGSWSVGVVLEAGDRPQGILVFVGTAADARERNELTSRLRLLAAVFASALARKESEDALRASDQTKSAILASLSGQVAVLDRAGRIIAANENWPAAARAAASDRPANGGGLSYAEACRRASRAGLPDLPMAVDGVQAVLEGSRESFTLDYPCHTDAGDRWFTLSAVPLRRPEGGAVAAHVDVTERHRAEDEARSSRAELAHFLRVSTVGELATSLAHELNQPLTAILANAQAAGMLLKANGNPGELREILADIVEEDKRAGEVIRRVRELLRKREPERAPLDLNALTLEVVRLVSGDAALRDVSIRLALARGPTVVNGDRIQLQQVVLNLILNAMDAMADSAGRRRVALVATSIPGDGTVHVSVSDTGPGLRDGLEGLVFEPFYTTKPNGMGMGLSIARSIIEAHGGRVWACGNAGAGATFTFTLPLTSPDPA